MATLIPRRTLLGAMALGSTVPCLLGQRVRAAESGTSGPIEAREIADHLTLFTGAGGNVVAHEGPETIALIDGGSPEASAALLQAVGERFGDKPVEVLVNTHWHPEQTGSNDTLGAQGVRIVAHENTRRWMTTRIEQHFDGPVFQPRAEVALPTHTFYISDTLQHGGESIPLVYTPRAHTDGDILVVFEQANVIAAGGVAYPHTWPELDTATNGWIGEMLDATRTLISRSDNDTIIVPAHGRLVTLDDLRAQEEMLDTILDRFRSMSRLGKGADDMLREGIADEYVARWGDPTDFIYTAWDGLWDHMRGLNAF